MSDIDTLVAAVRKSAKYRRVCEDVVRSVGERELAKGRRLKEAVKATKKKLHQVGGAYLEGGMDYADWLDDLKAASGSNEDFRWTCARVMGHHSSTRERLDILDEFYATVLADLSAVHSVLDLACGLNPLAIPWMGLPDDATYYAYDIYEDMVEFLRAFMKLTQVRGQETTRKGSGLGLTFCQMAVEAHGGRIWVEDGPQDRGSCFAFTIPRPPGNDGS